MEALETGRHYKGNFNVINHGSITNLPDDCVVEVPCSVDFTGIHPTIVGDLPLGCAAACMSNISVQRLAVEACVSGNDILLRQAMMLDLYRRVCDPPEIWQMVDELLVARKSGFRSIKKRLQSQRTPRKERAHPVQAECGTNRQP
jgi:alpha-galactosidase